MSPAPLRGVIFDMDGVLVDSHAAHRNAWRTFFQTLGRDVPEPELDFILDGRKRGDILRHFLREYPDTEIEELGRRKDFIFRKMQLEVSAVPGAVALVRELNGNGVALALATCASRSRAQSTLSGLGILQYFRVIVTGEDVALGKPDPAVYRMASEGLALNRQSLLAVEDAISGVRAAVGAGLHCIGVALHESVANLCAAGAVQVVPNFEAVSVKDLQEILRDCQLAIPTPQDCTSS
jgi:HAD superfamily hydrolase (TIGR01509 family)